MEKKNNLIINIKDKKEDNNDLPGFDNDKINNENINTDLEESKICWNCCKSLNKCVYSIPHEYITGIFYTNGNFCSYNCGLRYIIDNYSGHELWTRVSLLHIYHKINTGEDIKLKPAPNRKLLKVFGGNMSYEEYHKYNNYTVDIFTPPILPINNVEYSHENKKNNKKKNNNYRLYRKTPIKSKNDIYNTMQLIVE